MRCLGRTSRISPVNVSYAEFQRNFRFGYWHGAADAVLLVAVPFPPARSADGVTGTITGSQHYRSGPRGYGPGRGMYSAGFALPPPVGRTPGDVRQVVRPTATRHRAMIGVHSRIGAP